MAVRVVGAKGGLVIAVLGGADSRAGTDSSVANEVCTLATSNSEAAETEDHLDVVVAGADLLATEDVVETCDQIADADGDADLLLMDEAGRSVRSDDIVVAASGDLVTKFVTGAEMFLPVDAAGNVITSDPILASWAVEAALAVVADLMTMGDASALAWARLLAEIKVDLVVAVLAAVDLLATDDSDVALAATARELVAGTVTDADLTEKSEDLGDDVAAAFAPTRELLSENVAEADGWATVALIGWTEPVGSLGTFFDRNLGHFNFVFFAFFGITCSASFGTVTIIVSKVAFSRSFDSRTLMRSVMKPFTDVRLLSVYSSPQVPQPPQAYPSMMFSITADLRFPLDGCIFD